MRCSYACNSPDHVLTRRQFLGASAGAGIGAGFSSFTRPAIAAELARKQRQVLVIWLAGGASQLETWDPKPKTETGGPFRSIETRVPGVRISELLPRTAMQMHRLALLRSINTNENDHGKGTYLMHTGRPQSPATVFPHLGSVMARWLTEAGNPLPGYIHITPGGGGKGPSEAAFLGPRYNPSILGTATPRPTRPRTPLSPRWEPRADRQCRCTSTTGSPAAVEQPRPRRTPPLTIRPGS